MFGRAIGYGIAALVLGLGVSTSAHAALLFTGPYAVGNWTTSNTGPAGVVDTSGAPASIQMTSANSGGGFSNQFFTIAALTDGTVSFHWSYNTFDVDGSS